MADPTKKNGSMPNVTTTDFGKMSEAELTAMLAGELHASVQEVSATLNVLNATPLSAEDKEANAKLADNVPGPLVQALEKYKDVSVVIVEDDADLADALMVILNSLGIKNVTIFDSTLEARAYIRSFSISDDNKHVERFRKKSHKEAYGEEMTVQNLIPEKLVIFQDNDCPRKGSGIRFLKAFNIVIPDHNIAEIVYSGNPDLGKELALHDLRHAAFMTKPFSLNQVEITLDTALEKVAEKSRSALVSQLF